MLALAVSANFDIRVSGNVNPLRTMYATLLTLVGLLGVFVGIALVFTNQRIARLERRSRVGPDDQR